MAALTESLVQATLSKHSWCSIGIWGDSMPVLFGWKLYCRTAQLPQGDHKSAGIHQQRNRDHQHQRWFPPHLFLFENDIPRLIFELIGPIRSKDRPRFVCGRIESLYHVHGSLDVKLSHCDSGPSLFLGKWGPEAEGVQNLFNLCRSFLVYRFPGLYCPNGWSHYVHCGFDGRDESLVQ